MDAITKGVQILLFGAAACFCVPALAETAHVRLGGYHEVPAVSTTGDGRFLAKIDDVNGIVEYELTYSGLEGQATQAHIHFGQADVNGGIAVFLCTNLSNGPHGDEPACPLTSGTVRGMFDASDVIGPEAQGIAAGELKELIKAIRRGVTYANVHSTRNPGGEIRGQIKGIGIILPPLLPPR